MPKSPHDPAQSYDTLFAIGRLPAPSDPGWTVRRRKADGASVHMIRVHGPFDVVNGAQVTHCLDGWLVIETDGKLSVIADPDPGIPATEEVS